MTGQAPNDVGDSKIAFMPRCGIIASTDILGNLVMTKRDELEATYKVILAAARRKDLVRYSELIALHNWPEGNATRILGSQLNALVKICQWRGWPAMAVIVVRQHYDRLTDNNLKAFIRGARDAGYTIKDPEEFQDEQREFLYRWAPTAPDTLDLSDQEVQDLFQGTRDWHTNDDSLIDDSDQEDDSGEANAQPDNNPLGTSESGTKSPASNQDTSTHSDGNNEEIINQLREDVETLKEEQKKTNQTIKELQQEVENNHKKSLERTDSKFDKLSERLVYFVLAVVAIIVSAVGVSLSI